MIFQTRSVGVDIQPDSVNMAVAVRQGGHIKVLNLIEIEIPEATELDRNALISSAIRQAFRENRLNGDACTAALPSPASINRTLNTPLVDPVKISQTLKFQIEPQIPYPIEQVISDYLPIQKTDNGTELLAIAVTKNILSERLKILEAAGVDPQIITLDALALANFYTNPFDFSLDKVTALFITGPRSSFLGFFVGEKLSGFRNLDGLAPNDTKAAERMVKELGRSLVSFQPPTGMPAEIGTLCIAGTGVGALWKLAQESFRNVPVRTVEFNENMLVEIPPEFSDRAERCQLAIALAHAGLGASANTLNLRQEEFSPVSMLSRLKPNISFSLTILAVALVVWFGSVLARIHNESIQMKSLNEQMMKIFGDTMPGIKSPAAAEQRIKEEQEKFKSLRHYSSEYVSPLDILADVKASMPEGSSIVLNDLAVSENVLRMTGMADSYDDINNFKDRLENAPLFSAVEIVSATQAKKDQKKNFRIRAQIGRKPQTVSEE